MKWAWRDPADPSRTIELDVNQVTTARTLRVDGALIKRSHFGSTWSHSFALGERRASIRVFQRQFVVTDAELTIGDDHVTPESAPHDVPSWAWLLVAAGLAVLLMPGRGGITGAAAVVGVLCVLTASRLPGSLLRRLVLAVVSAGAGWAVYAILRFVVQR